MTYQLQRRPARSGEQSARRARISPNRADSVMIAFAPVNRGVSLIGIFGGDGSVYEPDAKIWG